MSLEKTEPRYDAAKRIRRLGYFVVGLVVVWCVAWFGIARFIDSLVTSEIQTSAEKGMIIDCPGQAVRGFPFRFGLFCDDTSFSIQADGVEVSAGALRSAAQFYNPRHAIAELDGPLVVNSPLVNAEVTWEAARASVVATTPLPRRASLEMRKPALVLSGVPVFAAGTATAHMRAPTSETEQGSGPGALDLALRTGNLARLGDMTPETGLPDVSADIDLRLDDGQQILLDRRISARALAGKSGELRRVGLLLTGDQGLVVSGPFSVNETGHVSGEFAIRIIDAATILDTLAQIFPDLADAASLISRLPATNGEITLTVTLREGKAFFGFIPLGDLPPLF